jgi:hypothetical protein
MDLNSACVALSQQASMAVYYAMIVGVVGVVIACASLFYRGVAGEKLRQTGERHDNLQMRYFNPSHRVVVQRPAEPEEPARPSKTSHSSHPWRSRR